MTYSDQLSHETKIFNKNDKQSMLSNNLKRIIKWDDSFGWVIIYVQWFYVYILLNKILCTIRKINELYMFVIQFNAFATIVNSLVSY